MLQTLWLRTLATLKRVGRRLLEGIEYEARNS
jgi:hypothetical protein